MWGFMEGWLTPSSLFLFLNLVIGTIFLTSRLSSPRRGHPDHHLGHSDPPPPPPPPPLARAPSLLERVRSIDFSLYKFVHPGGGGGGGYPEPERAQYGHSYPEDDFAGRRVDAPSFLERFKSINFSLHKFDHPAGYPEPDHVPAQGSYPEPQFSHRVDSPPLARAPSLVEQLKSFDFSLYKFQAPGHGEHSPEQDRVEPPRLARTPSLLERVKSINFSSFYRSSEHDSDADALHHLGFDSGSEDDADDSASYSGAGRVRQDHRARRIRSDPRTAAPGEAPARLPAKMKKSASERSAGGHSEEEEEDFVERRRPQKAREGRKNSGTAAAAASEEEGGDEIDAKADAFINRFKQHLKLQRLDSLKRFREMLSRGAA